MGRGEPGIVLASRPSFFTLDRKIESVNRAADRLLRVIVWTARMREPNLGSLDARPTTYAHRPEHKHLRIGWIN